MLRKGINSSQLKWLAAFTMLLDHALKVFQTPLVTELSYALESDRYTAYCVLAAIRGAGRMAAVIFFWCAGEGNRYASNHGKYLSRLLIFAVLSELPFQMLRSLYMYGELTLSFGMTNVIFTLLLGALVCFAHKRLDNGLITLAVLAAAVTAAFFLGTDYGGYGVLAVFTSFIATDKKLRLTLFGAVILLQKTEPIWRWLIFGNSFNGFTTGIDILFGSLAVVLLAFYNGEKGRQPKYFFYIFYPVHMILLVLLYHLIIA